MADHLKYENAPSAAAPSAAAPAAAKDMPLDTKCLAEAVIELNISRKNVSFYPPEHVQVSRSIERAYNSVCKITNSQPEITLGVVKDRLLVGEEYLDPKNQVYKELAVSLSRYGIAAVTFCRGLDKEELFEFLQVLSRKPEDLGLAGGIEQVVLHSNIAHIKIQTVDYGRFHLTEEKEIVRQQAGKKEAKGGDVWHDFVSHLVSGTLSRTGEGTTVNDLSDIDPSELARFINEHKLNTRAAIQSYEETISGHLRETTETKKSSKERSENLVKLNSLLQQLQPELRRQFLSATFRHCTAQSTPAQTEAFLGGFADNMVIEMLTQANEEGREISPTLMGLVQKMSRTSQTGFAGLSKGRTDLSETEQTPDISPEDLRNLFDRERYEGFVDPEYSEMLKHVSETAEIVSSGDQETPPIEQYLETLEESHIEFQVARALLALMDQDIKEDEYRDFSKNLWASTDTLLERGEFIFLSEVIEALTTHSLQNPLPTIRALAEESLARFKGPDFVSKAVCAFDSWSSRKGKEVSDFLLALGPEVIPGLLNLFVEKERRDEHRVLVGLLFGFGRATAVEAKKRLDDPRASVVKSLLMLIRRTGDQKDAPAIRPLLKDQDPGVRTGGLAALLTLGDPWAAIVLRKALRSKDSDVSFQAISLAGRYRAAEVTKDLVSMIKRVVFFRSDYQMNEQIIGALGQIGDPCAIPALEKLASVSKSLYPKSLSNMKVVLFGSLSGYPRKYLTLLLRIGRQSPDERIRRLCKELAGKQQV